MVVAVNVEAAEIVEVVEIPILQIQTISSRIIKTSTNRNLTKKAKEPRQMFPMMRAPVTGPKGRLRPTVQIPWCAAGSTSLPQDHPPEKLASLVIYVNKIHC